MIIMGELMSRDLWGGVTDGAWCKVRGDEGLDCCMRLGHVADGSETNVHASTRGQRIIAIWNVGLPESEDTHE